MLDPSPEAQVIRDNAERELDHLLYGTQRERDLLGLLVTAGGGLSSRDLAELTGQTNSEVDRQLRTVSGRTFSSRESTWRPQDGAKVFMLAHEELNATAIAVLGDEGIAGYREAIHAWADSYRSQGWPPGAPEYLLRDYHRILKDTNDLARMVAYATDRTRLDRMLEVSGGDTAALAEISACQSAICAYEMPDLYAMLLLARIREFLTDRNTRIPIGLPGVWAVLGNPIRAEILARSITDLHRQDKALTSLASVLAKAGRFDQAEALARSITDPDLQAEALCSLATILADVGRFDQAE
ncbi:hypothetical protein, partial [Nonomuraea sp. NPDC049504]|uniref:tetratricopeptide repeat protein n=1 Tax=Nonomuraea sp. NPDC049504 TaxID=3154729 RepID=UPI00341E6547